MSITNYVNISIVYIYIYNANNNITLFLMQKKIMLFQIKIFNM